MATPCHCRTPMALPQVESIQHCPLPLHHLLQAQCPRGSLGWARQVVCSGPASRTKRQWVSGFLVTVVKGVTPTKMMVASSNLAENLPHKSHCDMYMSTMKRTQHLGPCGWLAAFMSPENSQRLSPLFMWQSLCQLPWLQSPIYAPKSEISSSVALSYLSSEFQTAVVNWLLLIASQMSLKLNWTHYLLGRLWTLEMDSLGSNPSLATY